jgi:pyrroloquinoline-quinone synthase
MDIVQQIDSEIEKRSLLKHPFYQMWSEGKLTIDHLKGYSKEYFQLVKAVPGMVENIAKAFPSNQDIVLNAEEESDHVSPWINFASALGVEPNELESYEGDPAANTAVALMRKLSSASIEEGVAAMYAYEAELPSISRTKIEGLKKFYQIDSKDATTYFELHEEADVRHAQVWREILQSIPEERQKSALDAAVASLEAQNMLLDSVQKKYVQMTC